MAELVHHTEESAGGGASPFDTAIREIVADEDVLIACPYITLGYLESALQEATSWRLLTDVEAWLGNYSTSERESIREFIARYHEQIHDVRNLHAKAVIGETGAFVGSANLTWTGLQGRDELAVRFDEIERVKELREWFDGLWAESTPAKLDDIDEHIRTTSPAPSSAKRGSTTSISSDARRVNASLTVDKGTKQPTSEISEESKSEHEKLVKRVEKAPSREWIDRHFDLIAELLNVTGLTDDDPILVTSIPTSGGIHVTINHRVVIAVMRPTKSETGFILSDGTEHLEYLITEATKHETFSNPNDVPAPHLLTFDDGLERVSNQSIRRGWLKAIFDEVENRWKKAPRRKNHEPVVYRAATDHDYRTRVLNEAFEK
jgi:hypothetical protein